MKGKFTVILKQNQSVRLLKNFCQLNLSGITQKKICTSNRLLAQTQQGYAYISHMVKMNVFAGFAARTELGNW